MKTLTFLLIFIMAICYSLNAQNSDFRDTKWGMDTIQVKKVEVAKLYQSKKNSLLYNGKLYDLDTKIIYNFTLSRKLYHAAYIITLDSKNPQIYVTTFIMLQDLLTQKYKAPFDKKVTTINGKVITQEEWASNLISDNLNLETKWKNDKTAITLSIYSINDELSIEINYNSLEINNSEEQKTEIIKDL